MSSHSALLQALVLAIASILTVRSCNIVKDSCASCLSYYQCVEAGCEATVPPGAPYNYDHCSMPRRLVDDNDKCGVGLTIVAGIFLGTLTSVPLAMLFFKFSKERAQKQYAQQFLLQPIDEVARVQALLTKKEIVCKDWVGQEGKQSWSASHRGYKFFYYYFHLDFYTADQHVVAKSACRSLRTYEKYHLEDRVEVAYRKNKPQELLLVDDGQPEGIWPFILVLLMALAFVGFGFFGISQWACWIGYIPLGLIPIVALVSGKLVYTFISRPAEMSSSMVTLSPFTDVAAAIGNSTPPQPTSHKAEV